MKFEKGHKDAVTPAKDDSNNLCVTEQSFIIDACSTKGMSYEDRANTGLCVWEVLLPILKSDDWDNVYVDIRRGMGYCEMRTYTIRVLAPAVDVAYEAVSTQYFEPFDCEFVPSFLEHAESFIRRDSRHISESEAVTIGNEIVASTYGHENYPDDSDGYE